MYDKRIEDRRKKIYTERNEEREWWAVKQVKDTVDTDARQPCCQQNSSIIPVQQRQ